MSGNTQETGIVVPCFNEAARLDASEFVRFLKDNPHVSICFVNDGSTDNTSGVLKGLVDAASDRASLLEMRANAGKAEAVRAGMLQIMGNGAYEYLGYWDADLATPLEEILNLEKILDENPGLVMACGSRIKYLGTRIYRKAFRHYAGRVFASLASLVLSLPVYDTQCGAKLLRRDTARQVFQEPFISRWVFDVEIFARILDLAGSDNGENIIQEVPLKLWRDAAGSKVRPTHLPGIAFDLLRIALRQGRG